MINLLTGERVRVVGTVILLIIITIDFILAHDEKPGNTPREWLLTLTQKHYGAFVPYALGVLLGHFYHPAGTEGLLMLPEFAKLGIVLAIGALISIICRFFNLAISKYVLFIALFGMLLGTVVWPV